jgi:hypothetical protein
MSKTQRLITQGLFPTRHDDHVIEMSLLELYRKLNVRSALPMNSITDVMEGEKNSRYEKATD